MNGAGTRESFEGTPSLVLKRAILPRLLLGITLLPLALVTGGFAVSEAMGRPPDFLAAAILAGTAVVATAVFFPLFVNEMGRETRLFAEGIEQRKRSTTTTLRYSEVREVWLRAVKIQAGGLIGAGIGAALSAMRKPQGLDERTTSITIRVVGEGKTIKITSSDRGVARAYEEVLARVSPRLAQEALESIASGNAAPFGKVSISTEGIAFGKKPPIPLHEIERLYIEGGRLLVKCSGKWLRKGNVPVASIPNAEVLVQIFGALRGDDPAALKRGSLASRTYV